MDTVTAGIVVDTHTHSTAMLPWPAAAVYRAVPFRRPPDVDLGDLADAGVDAVVMKAVGDPIVTRWHMRPPFAAVQNQLGAIREQLQVGVVNYRIESMRGAPSTPTVLKHSRTAATTHARTRGLIVDTCSLFG